MYAKFANAPIISAFCASNIWNIRNSNGIKTPTNNNTYGTIYGCIVANISGLIAYVMLENDIRRGVAVKQKRYTIIPLAPMIVFGITGKMPNNNFVLYLASLNIKFRSNKYDSINSITAKIITFAKSLLSLSR
jgi:hypothetical protein